MSATTLTALDTVRRQITDACKRAGRSADSVTLVAVSKTHGAEVILPVLAAGQRVFGENRVQEAMKKWPELRQSYPDVRLHLIGPLQSNKVDDAVALFDVIQSVDRLKLVAALAKAMNQAGRHPQLFVQVNTGREPQKAGLAPEALADFLAESLKLHGVRYAGLMCIPPVEDDPRPHFRMLAELARTHGLDGLSMGMSGDYEVAIDEGATFVRVGSAIFGARPVASPPAAR
jgi:pyridoxal phosphate enzyme (YggS family)